MLKITKNNSLAKEFIILIVIVTIIIIGGIIFTTTSTYNSLIFNEQKNERKTALYIKNTIFESINIITKHMENVSTKILKKDPATISDIEQIIITDAFIHPLNNSISLIGWINKENYILVNPRMGVIRDPVYLGDKRRYLKYTHQNPGTFYFSEPTIGVPSDERLILPIGIGIKNDKKEFLGTLASGVSLITLQHKINQIVSSDKEFAYLLIDDHGVPIIKSEEIPHVLNFNFVDVANKIISSTIEEGALDNEVVLGSHKFKHFYKIDYYPFFLLTGVDQLALHKEYKEKIFPYIIEFIVIGIIFIFLLFYYRMQIIKPLSKLVDIVDYISKGIDTKIPNFDIYEIDILAEQVEKTRHFNDILQKEIVNKTIELNDALNMHHTTLEKILYYLKLPLEHAKDSLQKLSNNWNNIPEADKLIQLHIIEDYNLKSCDLINNIAELMSSKKSFKAEEKYVDVVAIAKDAIKKFKNTNLNKNAKIDITLNVHDTVNPIIKCVDYQIMQVFHYLLDNSIKYSGELVNIIISLDTFHQDNQNYLEVKVTDQGLGIPMGEEEQVFRPFIKSSRAYFNSSKGLGLAFCKKIIEQHNGKIRIDNSNNSLLRGTTVIFTLPYIKENLTQNNTITIKVEEELITLSNRESECAYLLLKEKSLKEIALILNISLRTVETHINNIKIKLRVSNKTDLVALLQKKSNIQD